MINIYNQSNPLQNNQNNSLMRQNTIPNLPPPNISPVAPIQNNNIQPNPYKRSKTSNINMPNFWERIDSRKNRNINNNTNIPSLPSPTSIHINDNNTHIHIEIHNHNHNQNNEEPVNEIFNFFDDFFNDTPRIPHSREEGDDGPDILFQPFFSPFGVRQGVFSHNYRSNFNRNLFDDLTSIIILGNRGRKQAHPPASKEALNKLKRFPLEQRFCKTNNGKLELPNCCICQSEIELGKETVLLPCGHMYHWDCCSQWLNTNNTCPICRFEIK